MKFVFALLSTVLMASTSFAGIQGFNGSTNLGLFSQVGCPTAGGLTCSKLGSQMQLSLATTPASTTSRTRFGPAWTPIAPTSATSVTASATTMYLTQVEVPKSTTFTGISILNAATVGTNKYIVALYSSAGVLLANSATAGVTTSGASAFQSVPFTATYTTAGARTLWIALQVNGATDTFYSLPAMAAMGGLAGSIVSVFATLPASITLPTTFTAGAGPVAFLY